MLRNLISVYSINDSNDILFYFKYIIFGQFILIPSVGKLWLTKTARGFTVDHNMKWSESEYDSMI